MFLTLTDQNVCNEARTIGHYYEWAPVYVFTDGPKALDSLLERAKTGAIFDGNKMIVEASNTPPNEQHLALCDVENLKAAAGPPQGCTTVAILTPTEAWLRGGDRFKGQCLTSASIRQTGAIDIHFTIQKASNLQPIADQLLRTLRDDLKLSPESEARRADTGKVDSISIKSAAALRNSTILPNGWRESMDFDIYLYALPKSIEISGTAHVLVCRQALGSRTEYQGPDEVQTSEYARVLNRVVGKAIKATCRTAIDLDAGHIECDQGGDR